MSGSTLSPAAFKDNIERCLQGADRELLELLGRVFSGVESLDVAAEVSRLLEAGATVDGACALHACAANHDARYVELLLGLTPSRAAAINARDMHGLTPLMVGAATAVGKTSNRVTAAPTAVCAKLLACGADRSLTDASGLTALGHCRKGLRGVCDFHASFGIRAHTPDCSALEALLMPPQGPTAEDDEIAAEDAGSDVGDY